MNVLIKYPRSLCYSLCLIIKKTKTTEWCGGGKADILNYNNYMLFTLLECFVRTWAVFVWPWGMVSLRSRYYLFYQPTKRSKVGLVILPVKKCSGAKSIAWLSKCRQPSLSPAWRNSQYFATTPLVFPRSNVWRTSAEIRYWWCVTSQIWVVLLIGRAAREICFNQSEALPRSWYGCVISVEFLRSFLRRHFARKPVLALRNVGCFQRLSCGKLLFSSKYVPCLLNEPKMPHALESVR